MRERGHSCQCLELINPTPIPFAGKAGGGAKTSAGRKQGAALLIRLQSAPDPQPDPGSECCALLEHASLDVCLGLCPAPQSWIDGASYRSRFVDGLASTSRCQKKKTDLFGSSLLYSSVLDGTRN